MWVGGENLKENDAWVKLRSPREKVSVPAVRTVMEPVGARKVAAGSKRRRLRKTARCLPTSVESTIQASTAAIKTLNGTMGL